MKKSKDSKDAALLLENALATICLCVDDWRAYGGRPMPEHLKAVLVHLQSEITNEAGELRSWLDGEVD